MLPLFLAEVAEEYIIRKISGTDEVKARLESLGLSVGAAVTVISVSGGDLIVLTAKNRVAISRDMAQNVYV